MRLRHGAFALTLAAASVLCAHGTARSADPPHDFVGRGQLAVDLTPPSMAPMHVGGVAAFESRDNVVRLDVVSLAFPPGTPSFLTGIGTLGITVVVDAPASRWVVWSRSQRTFYWGTLPKPTLPQAHPVPSPAGSAVPRGTSPFAGLKNLKSFYAHLDMTGHGTTDGHPTTGFALAIHREDDAGKIADLHATLQTADDLDGLPIQLVADAGSTGMPAVALRAEWTSIQRREPPKSDFLVPRGFSAAKSPADVLGLSHFSLEL